MPVALYDTTLRDGTQGENITLSLADKLRIARLLDDHGMPYIEGGWPGSNPKDIEFFKAAKDLRWSNAKLAAFGSTRHRSNTARTDPNLTELLAAGLEENLEMIAESVALITGEGRELVYDAEHFFDGYLANPAYALSTLRAALEGGARTLVLCDTNGGTLTKELLRVLDETRQVVATYDGGADVTFGIHTHNDAELAVAN